MMAEHGQLCNATEAAYCMNKATCYKISSMNLLSCVCRENYKGSRCEQYLLPVNLQNEQDMGLLAAVVIVAIFILVVLAFIIFYVHKMLKHKKQKKKTSEIKFYPSNMNY